MLEKLIALKEEFFSFRSRVKILALIVVLIIILGGAIVSISYLSGGGGGNKNAQDEQGATTTSNTLLKPDWDPQTRDICGDGVCGVTEEAGKNKCPRDCSSKIPLAIDNFTANPSVVTPGQTAVLSWSSTASFCASSGSDDAWFVTGGEPSGSVRTSPLQLSKTYMLSCMNNAGEMQMKEVTVTVESPVAKPTAKKVAPTITFTATPSTIDVGQSTTLFWVVANATSCIASGGASWGWAGARGTKGTQVTPALMMDEIYSLTCRGVGGSTTKDTRVTVNRSRANGSDPLGDFVGDSVGDSVGGNGSLPFVSFRTSPTTVVSGKTTTILWYSPDAASCVAGGDGASWGWKGAIPTSGAKITPPLDSNQSFAITCTSAQGGVVTKNASVEVTPLIPKPTITFTVNGVNKVTITSGEKVTLVWSSENTTSCNTSDYGEEVWDWHGELGVSGTRTTNQITSSKTYNIKCIGAGGSLEKYVTVTVPYVKPPGQLPTLKVTATPQRQYFLCPIKVSYQVTPVEGTTCDPPESPFTKNKNSSDPQKITVTCHTPTGDITSSASVNLWPIGTIIKDCF